MEEGIWIGEKLWGQNIASEALSGVCDHIFANTAIELLFATVLDYNTASIHMLEKCGFTRQCLFRKGAYKESRFVDLIYFDRLKQEDRLPLYSTHQ